MTTEGANEAARSEATAKKPKKDAYATYSHFGYSVSKYVVQIWARIWLRATSRHRDRCPAEGPVLIVANHTSFLDPPLVGTFCPRTVHFMARQTLAKIPLLGGWMARMGVVLLPKNATPKDSMRTVLQGLAQGRVVGIFPEGTRSTDHAVGPFQGGLEFLVKRSGATVLPCGVNGSGRALPKGSLFVRPVRCRVAYGEPWSPEQILAPGGAEALRREVARLADMPLREDLPAGDSAGGKNTEDEHPSSRSTASSVDGEDSRSGDGPQAEEPRVPGTHADTEPS